MIRLNSSVSRRPLTHHTSALITLLNLILPHANIRHPSSPSPSLHLPQPHQQPRHFHFPSRVSENTSNQCCSSFNQRTHMWRVELSQDSSTEVPMIYSARHTRRQRRNKPSHQYRSQTRRYQALGPIPICRGDGSLVLILILISWRQQQRPSKGVGSQ